MLDRSLETTNVIDVLYSSIILAESYETQVISQLNIISASCVLTTV